VDEDGSELGRHSGYWRFTPGQRKGLGVATGAPVYALRADARTNTVVVGSLEALARTSVEANGHLYVPVEQVDAKLRYRSDAVPARVHPTADGFRLELAQPVYGVAAGQAAVLYQEGVVVGAGIIDTDP
jgi:tRNA-specific 2-thiouridylase